MALLRFKLFSAVFLFMSPFLVCATDLSPWYPTMFEIQPRISYSFLHYNSLASNHNSITYHSNDSFVDLSIGAPYYQWYGEFELTFADTTHRSFGFDNFRITGRYQLMDDVALEDFLSVVAGITVTKASLIALHDLSSFHHGQFEGEVHLSLGKETSLAQFWVNHYWLVCGLGIADVGSPWIRSNANWEFNYFDKYSIHLFANTLWGFGNNSLSSKHHFKGYGPIHHQSVDLGLKCEYRFGCDAIITAGYAYTAYARNFPKNKNTISLSFLYPFGL